MRPPCNSNLFNKCFFSHFNLIKVLKILIKITCSEISTVFDLFPFSVLSFPFSALLTVTSIVSIYAFSISSLVRGNEISIYPYWKKNFLVKNRVFFHYFTQVNIQHIKMVWHVNDKFYEKKRLGMKYRASPGDRIAVFSYKKCPGDARYREHK